MFVRILFLLTLISACLFAESENQGDRGSVVTNAKPVYLTGVVYRFNLPDSTKLETPFEVGIAKNGQPWRRLPFAEITRDGKIFFVENIRFSESGRYKISVSENLSETIRVIPGWLSLLPPLAAIVLALIFRQVLIALFAGIWLGAIFIYGYNPLMGFLNTLTEYIGKAPADSERIAILIFSLTLGGMVGVMSKSGGTQGIVQKLSRYASNARRGQIATWFMGVLIFFDDYANTLIVGNTMRPLTDKLKISREKLSYLVDSTAAPVANIAIISTWIGFEISLISDAFKKLGLDQNAYITFFKTIPYNFYPIFSLIFGFSIAYFGRDFFSMRKAEQRCADGKGLLREGAVPIADLSNDELSTKEGVPLRWYNALVPVITVILTTLAGLWFTGLAAADISASEQANMGFIRYVSLVIGNSDSFAVLMWAAFIGSFVAIIMALWQRILNLNEAVMAWVGGVKAMVMAALILTLAWAIGNVCGDIQTAEYVIAIAEDLLSPHFVPVLSFLIAGVIAFSTGTSWGTMAILTPIVIPLAYQLPLADPTIDAGVQQGIFLSSIASILAGATFGDHCSPISDTTIMSSMASGADHIDHVRTQLPYALMAATISIFIGYIPIGFGFNNLASLLAGAAVIILLIRFAGKKAWSRF